MALKYLKYCAEVYAHSLTETSHHLFSMYQYKRIENMKRQKWDRIFIFWWIIPIPYKTVKHSKLDLSYVSSEKTSNCLKIQTIFAAASRKRAKRWKIEVVSWAKLANDINVSCNCSVCKIYSKLVYFHRVQSILKKQT